MSSFKISISQQVLMSLRGRQSARAASQKWGYSSNQFSRWEAGHSRFLWSDFVDLSDRMQLPLKETFEHIQLRGSFREIKSLLKFCYPGSKSTKDLAQLCGVSSLTIQRWLSGRGSPSVELVFRLMSDSGIPLSYFLGRILQGKKISSQLSKRLEEEEKRLSASLETPWTIGMACLCLLTPQPGETFSHIIKKVAKQMGLPVQQVEDTIQRLLKIRVLGYDEAQKKFYQPEGPAHLEFRNSVDSFLQGARFWAQYSSQRIREKKGADDGENFISYLVFNTSAKEIAKVHEKIIVLYKELSEQSQRQGLPAPTDRTLVLNMNLFNLDHPSLGDLIRQTNKT